MPHDQDVVDEAVTARPRGPLGTVVAEHHGYRQRGVAPTEHLGLPSPFLTLIVTVDEPLRIVRHVDSRQEPGDYDTLIGGLHTRPALLRHNGDQSGIQLSLSPLGARALFGLPAGELESTDLRLDDLLGDDAIELQERVRAAADWPARFAVLDTALGARADLTRRPPDEVREAWRLLLASRGTVRVDQLARTVGWSERHLAARFRTEIGLTPKLAARVVRYHRARRMLQRRRASGADVAATCGYADQSHLVHDFVRFTGVSPSAWLANEPAEADPLGVGNLQAADAATT